jgi:drug/metabolite transporter (DMT)-like permease
VNVEQHTQLRRIGWLLTPLLVWGGSFAGTWLGAVVTPHLPRIAGGLGWLILGGVLCGGAAAVAWLWGLRRAFPLPTRDGATRTDARP